MRQNKLLIRLNKINKRQFSTFLFVGLFCTGLNYFLLYFLVSRLYIHYMLSFSIVFLIGNLVGFFLNKKYTFKTSGTSFLNEIWKYYSVMFSNFLINLILIYILVNYFHVWYLYASLITTIGGIFYNFIMHKKWSFK